MNAGLTDKQEQGSNTTAKIIIIKRIVCFVNNSFSSPALPILTKGEVSGECCQQLLINIITITIPKCEVGGIPAWQIYGQYGWVSQLLAIVQSCKAPFLMQQGQIQIQIKIQIQIVQTCKAPLLMQQRQIQKKIQGLICTFGFALGCYSSLDCFGLPPS